MKIRKISQSKVKHSWKRYGVDFTEIDRLIEQIREILIR